MLLAGPFGVRECCRGGRWGGGWWRYRLPGFGQVDWRWRVDRLGELGYEGSLAIEHTAPVWQGSLERVKQGLSLARRHLAQFST